MTFTVLFVSGVLRGSDITATGGRSERLKVKVQYTPVVDSEVLLVFQVKEYLKLEYEKGGKPRDDPFYQRIIDDIFRKSDNDRDGAISAKEYNIYEHDEL